MILKEEMNDSERIYRNYKLNSNMKPLTFGITDMFNYYIENRIRKPELSKAEVNRIFGEFNKEISKQIVYNNFEFRMPAGLGTIRISKRKMLPPIIDEYGKVSRPKSKWVHFNKTKELWARDEKARKERKKIYINYEHEYFYSWKWDKSSYKVRHKQLYRFLPSRANKKLIFEAASNPAYNIEYFK